MQQPNYQNMYQQQPQTPMKPCKHCKQMIDKKANVCPYCHKTQGISGCLIALIVMLVVGAVIGLLFVLLVIIGISTSTGETASEHETEAKIEVQDTNSIETTTEKIVMNGDAVSGSFTYEVTDTRFDYYQNSIGNYEYYGIVEITNTGNTNIYLGDCTFDLEDNDGHLLQSDDWISSCPEIIAPGEKGYFYNNIGSNLIDETVSLDNGINLVPNFKIENAYIDDAIVDYEVSDVEMREDDYGFIKMTGRVTNNTDEDDSLCYVEFVFKDSDGKVLFIFGTNVTDLTAGSTKSFDTSAMFSNDSINKDDIASYEVIARKTYYQF